jgi:hypothetical protein
MRERAVSLEADGLGMAIEQQRAVFVYRFEPMGGQ